MKVSVRIAWFPYGHVIDDRAAAYLAKLTSKLEKDERVMNYGLWSVADTPITMVRNRCLAEAESAGADFVLMLDSDNIPDIHLGDAQFPEAKPFWETAFDFALAHNGPCIVAAPYCGPPPQECVYAFDWTNHGSHSAQPDFALEMVPRHDAARRRGILPAAAMPTGVMLIDMRAVKKMPHPRFYYEYRDETQSHKASTEDVVFTRDCWYCGTPVYAAWDSWAGHVKSKVVGKPMNIPVAWVPKHLRDWGKAHVQMGTERKADLPPPVRPRNTYASVPPGFPADFIKKIAGDPFADEIDAINDEADAEAMAGVNGDHGPVELDEGTRLKRLDHLLNKIAADTEPIPEG